MQYSLKAFLLYAVFGISIFSVGTSVQAQASKESKDSDSKGILPIRDYSGDFWSSSYLTGDWNGARTELAKKGIQFDLRWTEYAQRVTTGGLEVDNRIGGKGDYVVTFDLMRMNLIPGAFVKFRAESRYGKFVNDISGQVLSANTDALFPLTRDVNDDVFLAVTNLTYYQFLSERFGVFFGKIDTLDGDLNEFASGRGTSQFMNSNFIFNSTLALRMPYSTLGAGFLWRPEDNVTITSSLFNTLDSSTTTGLDDFGDGASWSTEVNFQYRFANLPGGQNVGFLYSFDQDFTELNSRLVFQPGQGLSVPSENSTWAAYWSTWQYLTVEDSSDALINVSNGKTDRQGVGVFARLGVADQETNPIKSSMSLGVGGRGIFSKRDDDTFGVGYFYNNIQRGRLSGLTGVKDESQGAEAFYNFAITPAAHLTCDAQLLESASSNVNTSFILGLRLSLSF